MTRTFKIGDVVTVTAHDHPHYGDRAIIVRPSTPRMQSLALDWIAKNATGYEFGIGEYEMTVPPKRRTK